MLMSCIFRNLCFESTRIFATNASFRMNGHLFTRLETHSVVLLYSVFLSHTDTGWLSECGYSLYGFPSVDVCDIFIHFSVPQYAFTLIQVCHTRRFIKWNSVRIMTAKPIRKRCQTSKWKESVTTNKKISYKIDYVSAPINRDTILINEIHLARISSEIIPNTSKGTQALWSGIFVAVYI